MMMMMMMMVMICLFFVQKARDRSSLTTIMTATKKSALAA